jgi:hypothetical protein
MCVDSGVNIFSSVPKHTLQNHNCSAAVAVVMFCLVLSCSVMDKMLSSTCLTFP